MDIKDITIQHAEGLNQTDIVSCALHVNAELISKGQMQPIIAVFWDDDAIIARYGSEPVGFITYKYSSWTKTNLIHLGFVEPGYRRLGIYRLMWNSLVEKSRQLGAVKIDSSTHISNERMRAVAKALGREEESVNLGFKL